MLDTGVDQGSSLTRRRLLQSGGAAFAVTLVDLHGWVPALASGVSGSAPAYLRRSSYVPLTGQSFTVASDGQGSQTLTLLSVSDLDGPGLAGSEDAFRLEFSGPLGQSMQQGVYRLTNPALGPAELFIAAVDRPQSAQGYELIVDRSLSPMSASAAAPAPVSAAESASREATTGGSAAGVGPAQTGSGQTGSGHPGVHSDISANHPHTHAGAVRAYSTRRSAHGVLCELTLAPDSKVDFVRAWLMRGRHVLGVAERRVHGSKVSLDVHTGRRPPSGRYELVIATTDGDGVESMTPHPLILH